MLGQYQLRERHALAFINFCYMVAMLDPRAQVTGAVAYMRDNYGEWFLYTLAAYFWAISRAFAAPQSQALRNGNLGNTAMGVYLYRLMVAVQKPHRSTSNIFHPLCAFWHDSLFNPYAHTGNSGRVTR
jgi:hypothetical protein